MGLRAHTQYAHREERALAAASLVREILEENGSRTAAGEHATEIDVGGLSKGWFKIPSVYVYRLALMAMMGLSTAGWGFVTYTFLGKHEARNTFVGKSEFATYQESIAQTLNKLAENQAVFSDNLTGIRIILERISFNTERIKQVETRMDEVSSRVNKIENRPR